VACALSDDAVSLLEGPEGQTHCDHHDRHAAPSTQRNDGESAVDHSVGDAEYSRIDSEREHIDAATVVPRLPRAVTRSVGASASAFARLSGGAAGSRTRVVVASTGSPLDFRDAHLSEDEFPSRLEGPCVNRGLSGRQGWVGCFRSWRGCCVVGARHNPVHGKAASSVLSGDWAPRHRPLGVRRARLAGRQSQCTRLPAAVSGRLPEHVRSEREAGPVTGRRSGLADDDLHERQASDQLRTRGRLPEPAGAPQDISHYA